MGTYYTVGLADLMLIHIINILEGDIGNYLTVDGAKSKWEFIPSGNNNIFLLQHEEDVDEDTANPKIVRLQIKNH